MKIVSIVSARPNFVKLASLHHALSLHPAIEHLIIHTGQHYDPLFSDVFFKELAIPTPQENLGVKSGATNEETVERTREACLLVLQKHQPDLVLVYGDVSGALGGAEAAHQLKIPVGHVEAGLRSFDEDMPEERNRKAIDHLAQLLFVTEKSGVENLENENITKGVHFVGNTMIDTLRRNHRKIFKVKMISDAPAHFGLVTLHRPSNVDSKEDLQRNLDFLGAVAKNRHLIFPVHFRTAAALERYGLSLPQGVERRDPFGYIDFLRFLGVSDFVITDSGGIQEETTYLGVQCFTLRENTERPCTLQENGGTNTLIDSDKKKQVVLDFASQDVDYIERANRALRNQPEKWDGGAGERIADIIISFLNKS